MEAALAEFKAEDLGQDVEEDVDFVVQVGGFGRVRIQSHFQCLTVRVQTNKMLSSRI